MTNKNILSNWSRGQVINFFSLFLIHPICVDECEIHYIDFDLFIHFLLLFQTDAGYLKP